MKLVTPTVLKIAETQIHIEEIMRALEEYGEEAKAWFGRRAFSPGQTTESLIETAGRVCYKSFVAGLNPNVTKIREDSREYFENILKKGDGSILEHGTVTFAFLGWSRVFSHELVRHRAGAAYSQESLRYVRFKEGQIPITDTPIPDAVQKIAHMSGPDPGLHFNVAEYDYFNRMIPWDKLSFDEKKQVTSYLRRILPQGMATNVIATFNHRTLRWLIEMRTSPAAEVEIRLAFNKVAEICLRDFPLIYQDFQAIPNEDGISSYVPKLRSKV